LTSLRRSDRKVFIVWDFAWTEAHVTHIRAEE